MLIYNYDEFTKEYLSTSEADPSPLEEGVFLIPAHATDVELPIVNIEKTKCFFRDGAWVQEKIYTTIEADTPPMYFRHGNITLVTDEEAQTITKTYELIPFSEEEMKIIKDGIWSEIKNIRDERQVSGVKIIVGSDDYWFHTDIQSQIQHLGLYESAKNHLNSSVSASMSDDLKLGEANIIWKCMGNKMLILTVQIVFDLIEADKKLMNDTFINSEILKAGLYESTDPVNFDVTTGWPVKFGEL
jgi:hypothetical protein